MKTTTIQRTSKGQTSFLRADVTDSIVNDDGTITFPLSSEEPYKRWYWEYGELDEILSHDTKAVDLSWLKSGNAPLLNTHARHTLENVIGVIIDAELRDSRVYVTARLSNAEDDVSTVQKILDGIIRNVSIGYDITQYTIDEEAKTYTATRWMPKEASFVPLPADPTVGIGRTAEAIGDYAMKTATTTPDGGDTVTVMPGMEPDDVRTDEERATAFVETTNEIAALAATHNMGDVARDYVKGCVHRGEEPSLAYFKGIVRMKLPEGTPLVNTDIGLNENEKRSFSLLALMRKLDDNKWDGGTFELEAAQAARAAADKLRVSEHTGLVLPTDLMNSWGSFEMNGVRYDSRNSSMMSKISSQLRAALATSGNPNILTTDHLEERFIDNLRNQSAVLGAGATMLDGLSDNIEIPGGDQNIVANWLAAEDADAAESNPTFRKVTLEPHDVAVYTDLTRRMIQQSTIAMEAYVRAQQVEAMRLAIDLAALYGSGATGIPLGLANIAGIGSKTFAGEYPTRGEIIDLRTGVAVTNRGRGVTYLGNSDMVGALQQTDVQPGSPTGQFLMGDSADRLVGNPFNESNQVNDGDLFAGVWSDMLIGMWGGIQIDRSTERKFLSGGVSFRSIGTVDMAVTRVGSFGIGNVTLRRQSSH